MVMRNQQQTNDQDPIVLIVDDNPINIGVIADYLTDQGFDIMVATDGQEALEIVQESLLPDIILLDVMMPIMDGFETCRRLKADETTQDIPVIFMTSLADTANKMKAFALQAVDYVTKPVNQEEVMARIHTHLTIRQQRLALQKANALLSKRTRQLEASNQISRQITAIMELNPLLIDIVQTIASQFHFQSVQIWLFDEQTATLKLKADSNQADSNQGNTQIQLALDDEKSTIVQAYNTGDYHLENNAHITLHLPLRMGPTILGVLHLQALPEATITVEDISILESLAAQMAIAIHNAYLFTTETERAEALALLNANKDKFFSIISHDLRSPFNLLIAGSGQLMQQAGTLPIDVMKDRIDSLHQSAKVAYNLLENLLTWSRIQRGHMAYQPETITVQTAVHDTLTLFQENAIEKGIILIHQIAPSLLIYADPNMFDTIIRNLVSNALKFTHPTGRVTVSSLKTEDNFAQIAVTDTGTGISADTITKLFRLDIHHTTQGTAQEQGTGLGLLLCKEMVEKNGGTISIRSKLGQGTTVHFTIPLDPTFQEVHQLTLGQEVIVTNHTEKTLPTPTIFTPPPTTILAALQEMLRRGNLNGIEQEAKRLKEMNTPYQPFATHLHQLAANFEDDKITALFASVESN